MILLFAIIGGLVIGAIVGRTASGLADTLALMGHVFIAATIVVGIPLVTSQLALALNNPRERVRRGVSQAKVFVRSLVATVLLLIVSIVAAGLFLSGEQSGSVGAVFGRLDPEKFMIFGSEGGVMQALMLAVIGAVVLGALGLRATGAVTFFNRVSRASVRTFRLLLWLAPLGLLGITAELISGGTTLKFGLSVDTTTPLIVSLFMAASGFMVYATAALGIDWMVGQLRPKRKDRPAFERSRPPLRGPRPGFQPTGAPRGQGRDRERPAERPAPRRFEPRPTEQERSPFDMGVSSTPVLDIETGHPQPAPPQRSPSEPSDDQG
ncbi:MAG: cation:dicarboxylase symporter family transporter, partial [candidate division Zixibacteria bacterium]|nr:cation:dicarboxylase symporter family transporter [candidate division Zixibacteria bacterium]